MNMKPSHKAADAYEDLAALIRQSSEDGRLIAEDELLACAAEQGIVRAAERPESFRSVLDDLLNNHDDVHELNAQDSVRRLYSSRFMTEAYALILLHKQEDPLQLITGIVRQNSRDYPRPVPLDIFMVEPFGMAFPDVAECVRNIMGDKAYSDIQVIETSTSRQFLYSTFYLEPTHAALLAEWYDVGQAINP